MLSRKSSIPDEGIHRNPSEYVDTSIQGSSGIANVLLRDMSTLSIQGVLSRKSSIPDEGIHLNMSTLSIHTFKLQCRF